MNGIWVAEPALFVLEGAGLLQQAYDDMPLPEI